MMKTKRPIHNYPESALNDALKVIREEGIPIREASRLYGVPRGTIQDRLHNRVPEAPRKMGPATVLSNDEEIQLVEWLKTLAKCGFPRKKHDLLNTVQMIVSAEKKQTPFKEGRPGSKWYEAFLKRHPEIAVRTAEGITKGRAVITEESIRKWFNKLLTYLEEINATDILEDPDRILNGDETSFSMCPKTDKVLAPKGYKNVYDLQFGNEKETITVLLVFTASGLTLTPMVVFPYVRPPKEVVNSVPEDWFLGRSETGWMKSEIFFEYVVNGVDKWIVERKIRKPVLLFVDGHKSHLTMELSTECAKRDIILYSLPPNTTHIMQPADVSVFKPLKSDWKKTVREWQYELVNVNKTLNKGNFCPLLKKVLSNENIPESIKNGFRKCGLYPLNPNAVDYTKCVQNKLEELQERSNEEKEEKLRGYVITQNILEELRTRLSDKGLDVDKIIECVEEEKEKLKHRNIREEAGNNTLNEEVPLLQTENAALDLDTCPPGLYEVEVYSNTVPNSNEANDVFRNDEMCLLTMDIEPNNPVNSAMANSVQILPTFSLSTSPLSASESHINSSYSAIEDHTYSNNEVSDDMIVLPLVEDTSSDHSLETLLKSNQVDTLNSFNETSLPPIENSTSFTAMSTPEKNLNNVLNPINLPVSKVPHSSLALSNSPTAFSSQFQSHLYYPTAIIKSKKRKSNQNLPLSPPKAISSSAWREWYLSKEKIKKDKEEIVRKRKEERQRIAAEKALMVSKKKSRPMKKARTTAQNTSVCENQMIFSENESFTMNNNQNNTYAKKNNTNVGSKKTEEKQPEVSVSEIKAKNKKITCKECDEELVSDVEENDLKNIGCDNCSNWFHLKCTEFKNENFENVINEEFKCHFC